MKTKNKRLTEIKKDVIIYLKMKGIKDSDIARALRLTRARVSQISEIIKNKLDKK